MKSSLTMVLVPFVLLAAAPWASASNSLNTAQIEKLTGLSGKLSSNGEVFKISYPRKDLKLKANGVVLTPALGLTAWAAFQRA